MKDSVTQGAAGKIYKTTQNSKMIFDKETCSFDLILTENNAGCQMVVSANWVLMANESLQYDVHIAGYTSDNNLKNTNTSIIDKSRYFVLNFYSEGFGVPAAGGLKSSMAQKREVPVGGQN